MEGCLECKNSGDILVWIVRKMPWWPFWRINFTSVARCAWWHILSAAIVRLIAVVTTICVAAIMRLLHGIMTIAIAIWLVVWRHWSQLLNKESPNINYSMSCLGAGSFFEIKRMVVLYTGLRVKWFFVYLSASGTQKITINIYMNMHTWHSHNKMKSRCEINYFSSIEKNNDENIYKFFEANHKSIYVQIFWRGRHVVSAKSSLQKISLVQKSDKKIAF